MKQRGGFTLIELMIVIAIIAIIAAIAIPNLLRSRMTANEASACGAMRTISTAEVAFQAAAIIDANSDGNGDYGTLAQLGDPYGNGTRPSFVDAVLIGGYKQGYTFNINVTLGAANVAAAYTCTAIPTTPGKTGWRQYFVDDTGVIRFTSDGTGVSPASSPLN